MLRGSMLQIRRSEVAAAKHAAGIVGMRDKAAGRPLSVIQQKVEDLQPRLSKLF